MARIRDEGEGVREQTIGYFQNDKGRVQGHSDCKGFSKTRGCVGMTMTVVIVASVVAVMVRMMGAHHPKNEPAMESQQSVYADMPESRAIERAIRLCNGPC